MSPLASSTVVFVKQTCLVSQRLTGRPYIWKSAGIVPIVDQTVTLVQQSVDEQLESDPFVQAYIVFFIIYITFNNFCFYTNWFRLLKNLQLISLKPISIIILATIQIFK